MSDDLISRQAAIMGLIFSDGTRDLTCGQMAKILNAIKALPSAQPDIIRCKTATGGQSRKTACKADVIDMVCTRQATGIARRQEKGGKND